MFDFLYVFKGLSLVFKPGLRRYVIIPLSLSAVLLLLLGWLAVEQFDAAMAWLLPREGWMHYLSWLLAPIFALAYLLIVFYGYTLLANLIGAPFNGRLAEAVEYRLAGRTPPPLESAGLMKEAAGALITELRKLVYFLIRAIPILLLMLIPGINAVAAILWILLSSWFLCLEYIAYPMENHGHSFKQQRSLLSQRPLGALSFGGGVMLLMLIPGLNLTAMPAAVAGSTQLWVEKLRDRATG